MAVRQYLTLLYQGCIFNAFTLQVHNSKTATTLVSLPNLPTGMSSDRILAFLFLHCYLDSYCLVSIGGSTNFYSVFESELGDVIPIIHTSIGGTRIVGRLTAGTSLDPNESLRKYSY